MKLEGGVHAGQIKDPRGKATLISKLFCGIVFMYVTTVYIEVYVSLVCRLTVTLLVI